MNLFLFGTSPPSKTSSQRQIYETKTKYKILIFNDFLLIYKYIVYYKDYYIYLYIKLILNLSIISI